MRKNIAAGNWKMNKTFNEALDLTDVILSGSRDSEVVTILSVPSLYLNKIKAMTAQQDDIHIAAQNCHHKEGGAYTGELSAPMLASIGIEYVVIGHSERRAYFGEDASILTEKLAVALKNNLKPIFCCGEPLEIRKSGEHVEYVLDQLKSTIFGLNAEDISKCIIAYEPIWAIGTGETATSEQAQEMHYALRAGIAQKYSQDLANDISILYGGSVKPSNAQELFGKEDVDGGLVGGASLKGEDFLKIINAF